ncbi:hypothetical protein [Parasphingorhabdus sp.]|uniref:hypothetical protein n=1 Tax=Parasphingorhabdus sp. TaxID=2709688 RepID=UPI0032991C8E
MLVKLGAALATLTALIHIFVGHFDTLLPLLSSDLSPAVLGSFHACWHIVSVFLAYSAWRFWSGGQIAVHLAIIWILFSVIFVAVGIWQLGLGGLLILPQWVLLGPSGGLVLIGLRSAKQSMV